MKLSQMFIGQIVESTHPLSYHGRIREIGHVVGLGLAYSTHTIAGSHDDKPIPILPLVKFVGEEVPRTIHPNNLRKYKD
jgi:hypothetical protein